MSIREKIMIYALDSKLRLLELESGDMIGDKVEIEAVISCRGKKRNAIIEKMIDRLSLHKDVASIGWKNL